MVPHSGKESLVATGSRCDSSRAYILLYRCTLGKNCHLLSMDDSSDAKESGATEIDMAMNAVGEINSGFYDFVHS